MYKLRDYQVDLIDRLNQSWNAGNKSTLVQLSTGGGKTIVFSHVINSFRENNAKCLVLAHREELIKQATDKIESITNENVGIIKSGYKPDYSKSIQVASVQSLTRRLDQCPQFDLIVIDECHHSTAKSYQSILNFFPNAKILGVSATPCRLNGGGFRGTFDELICGTSTQELIEIGSLSKYKYFGTEKTMSLDNVHKSKGDYKSNDVAKANPVKGLAGDVVESYCNYLKEKQAVVFCVNVEHSIAITEHFRVAGISSAHLDGDTLDTERKDLMAAFKSGKINVLTNCALFDEGLDIPGLDGVILARPTASLSRFLQMVGRALRPSETKEYAVIVDLAENWMRHGMPDDDREWSLDGIQKVKASEKKKLERQASGEIVEIIIDLSTTGKRFIEIEKNKNISPELIKWTSYIDELIDTQQTTFKKPSWCSFKLLDSKERVPLEAWKYLGKKLGYHYGWANHKFKEWEDNNSVEQKINSAPVLDIQTVWKNVLERLSPSSKALFSSFGKLVSITTENAIVKMKTTTMKNISANRVTELNKCFSDITGSPIKTTIY